MTRKWLILIFIFCCTSGKITAHDNSLKLWYDKPAKQWVEALPLGNGRIGAMVFGDPAHERLQLNEETVWGGSPHNNTNPNAKEALPRIRRLIFEGKNKEAQELCGPAICSQSANGMPYQTVGTLHLDFEGINQYDDFYRPVAHYQINSIKEEKYFFHGTLYHTIYRKYRILYFSPQRTATKR